MPSPHATSILRLRRRDWTVLALLLSAFLSSAPSPVAAGAEKKIGNGIYEVRVQLTPSPSENEAGIGSWTASTGPAHTVGAARDLLYPRRIGGRFTSFSSLRIHGAVGGTKDYVVGGRNVGIDLDAFVESEGASPLAPAERGWRTVWSLDGEELRIVQDVVVVGTDTDNSVVYHTVAIENQGDAVVRVGWRNLYDWMVVRDSGTAEDGPSNALESVCGGPSTAATTEFSRSPVISQVVRVAHPAAQDYQPLLALTHDPGSLPGIPVTAPDEFAYVSWSSAKDTAFDYTTTDGLDVSDDSAGLSWFGPTPDSALRIPAGGSIRRTQALLAREPAGCPRRCVTSSGDRILCVPGQPGRFTYEVVVRNSSGVDVHDVEVLLPSGVTAELALTPDILPIVRNQPRRLRITLTGAPSGDVVPVILVLRNVHGDEICSVEKLVRLPACDCAQITRSSPPTCFGFGPSQQFTDSFDLENLLGDSVHHVVLSPVSPAGATLTPEVVHLTSDPQETGARRSFTTRLGGVPAGAQACYRISTHDAAFEECCSIERCVTVPRCTVGVDDFRELGNATTRFADGLITVADIGGSGDDGVAIDVRGSSTWEAEWLPIDLSTLPEGAGITTTVRGQVEGGGADEPIVTMQSRVTAQGLELEADFGELSAGRHLVELYLDDELVGSASGQPAMIAAYPDRASSLTTDSHYTWGGHRGVNTPASIEVIRCEGDDGFAPPGCRPAGFTFSQPLLFDLFGALVGPLLLADEVRIYPEDAGPRVGALSEVRIQAANVPSLTVVSSSTDFDCNANAVADFEDVLGTGSGDGNGNGVPDECEVCASGPQGLCLDDGRFAVEVEWRDFGGRAGRGQAVPLTRDAGAFWFFRPENVELAVKVLDGRDVNGHWWVFVGALTNVEFRLTLTDLRTGASRSYFNPLGAFASIGDTRAFPAEGDGAAGPAWFAGPPISQVVRSAAATETCSAGSAGLCLHDGRFRVEVAWRDADGQTRTATAVPITDQAGYFWFFGDSNVEVVIKVLDGRPVNGHWWVFYGGLSDSEYTITVTDTETGATSFAFNPRGSLTSAADTRAF